MKIIGIDPGIANTGYGVIQLEDNIPSLVDYGCIVTKPADSLAERLRTIYDGLSRVFADHRPAACAIESIFFAKNARSAFQVGHARGVIILCASLHGSEVAEYTPLQVKKNIVGTGSAEKAQVQYMTKMLLRLKEIPSPDHAADALALALCYSNTIRLNAALRKSQ